MCISILIHADTHTYSKCLHQLRNTYIHTYIDTYIHTYIQESYLRNTYIHTRNTYIHNERMNYCSGSRHLHAVRLHDSEQAGEGGEADGRGDGVRGGRPVLCRHRCRHAQGEHNLRR